MEKKETKSAEFLLARELTVLPEKTKEEWVATLQCYIREKMKEAQQATSFEMLGDYQVIIQQIETVKLAIVGSEDMEFIQQELKSLGRAITATMLKKETVMDMKKLMEILDDPVIHGDRQTIEKFTLMNEILCRDGKTTQSRP